MAGHSKWANIKHRKARQDDKRGRMWSKCARAIIVAARAGGGPAAEHSAGERAACEECDALRARATWRELSANWNSATCEPCPTAD